MSKARWLAEVEAAVTAVPRNIAPGVSEAYIGGGQSKLRYHGIKMPNVHAVSKAGFSFLAEDEKTVLAAWDHIWNESELYEAMLLALMHYGAKKRRAGIPAVFPKLKGWVKRIDNWAHSDCLSLIYAHALEAEPKLVLPVLQKWSDSKHPWERRQSLVSLLYYSSQRERVLPFATLKKMVEAQIAYDHMYVQKGVGWTLREMGNVYPRETLRFLGENAEELSATAFSAATEKLAPRDKERLKGARKLARTRGKRTAKGTGSD